MIYPLVRELAGDRVPVTVTCRVLGIARQPYYRWLACPVAGAELDEAYLANASFDAHRDHPEFGYRFLADEVRLAGRDVCDRTVWRICRDNGWWSSLGRPRRRKGRSPGTPAHDDVVRRDFTAGAPNRLWPPDITEHPTGERTLYMCAIKDAWSNRMVGYSIDERMKARLVVTRSATRSPVGARPPAASCIRSAAASSAHARLSEPWPATASSAPWARSARPATTPRWSPSSRSRNAVSWTATDGTPVTSCASPPSPGSNAPTTDVVASRPRTPHPIEYEMINTPPATQAA
jgi:hypothetical protein